MKPRVIGLGLALTFLLIGCGGGAAPRGSKESDSKVARADAQAVDGPAAAQAVARKIIYTAGIELLVDNIEQADQQLRQLVAAEKGAYVAKAEIRGSPGSPRYGSWTLRVPVEQFETFRLAVLKLGEEQRESLDSQDVTDQYYDLDARIKNNQARVESLRKLLDKAAEGKIEDYLAVQKRLDEVTAELDVQKGLLTRLDKLSALATVNVTMHERLGYVRPEAPGFGTRIRRTFGGSLDALQDFG
jgi:Domain of unknown function (DUF4349)